MDVGGLLCRLDTLVAEVPATPVNVVVPIEVSRERLARSNTPVVTDSEARPDCVVCDEECRYDVSGLRLSR